MSAAPFLLAQLASAHDRSVFHCGSEALDRYLREQVTQDIRRRITACFVALTHEQRIVGYYTLASASVPLLDLPQEIRKKMPRYPAVPAVRMGRLAVDRFFARQGLGGALLADAIARATKSEIAAYALIVEAKDEAAAGFYHHHGFITLPDSPLRLFLPFAAVSRDMA
jgi:ribosomal protein S18 acetylase RimI-like enzyme